MVYSEWEELAIGQHHTLGVEVGGAVLRHLKVAIWNELKEILRLFDSLVSITWTLLLVTSFLTALWKLCISETDPG